MEPAAKTWSQSSHNDVTCTECHVPPGIGPATRWRLKEARNVWADYLGMSVTSDERHLPKNENCLQCHPLSEIPSETGGLRMNHEQHLAVRGLYCADCHDTVSHKKPGEAQGVRMLTCSMCHNEQGAPDGCDFCHATPASSEHAPDFMKDHGKEARLNEAECLRCHHDRKSFCDECHSAPPASHYSGKWRYTHDERRRRRPRELRGLPRRCFLRPVPLRESSLRLAGNTRGHRREGPQRLPRVSSAGHV